MSTVKFKRTLRRCGGSASIALPPEIVEALELKIGDKVEMWIENGTVVVRKTKEKL